VRGTYSLEGEKLCKDPARARSGCRRPATQLDLREALLNAIDCGEGWWNYAEIDFMIQEDKRWWNDYQARREQNGYSGRFGTVPA
jgi:hypothetical protein